MTFPDCPTTEPHIPAALDEEKLVDTHWTSKALAATDTLAWILKLNAWWWLLTIVGLGLFGVSPATAAAAIAVRSRSDGNVVRWADVFRAYRANFVGANLALAPALIVLCLLGWNALFFSAGPSGRTTPEVLTLIAAVIFGTSCCYLPPLYAFYDLPRHRYILTAIKITLARPLWSVVMALVTAAVIVASTKMILLVPVFTVGLWVNVCSWLGIRFFTENEDRRAAAAQEPSPNLDRGPAAAQPFALPVEPLRMR